MVAMAAHTEALGGKSSFPPFQSESFPSQLLWLILTFVLLYVLMSRIALPRIGSIMAERSRRIAEHIAAAQSFRDEAETNQAACEKALAEACGRAATVTSLEREQQAAASRQAGERLEARLRERLSGAERSIAAARVAAMDHVAAVATELAPAIVQRLTGKVPAAPDVATAIADESKR
jgi:F-type H+-transporting ATPase subunit b